MCGATGFDPSRGSDVYLSGTEEVYMGFVIGRVVLRNLRRRWGVV